MLLAILSRVMLRAVSFWLFNLCSRDKELGVMCW